ncbi:cytochrome C assembly family protein [Aurantivibrio infirmus]
MAPLFNYLALAIYLLGSAYLVINFANQRSAKNLHVIVITLVAMVFHVVGAQGLIIVDEGFHFGLFQLPTLIFLVVNLLVLLSGLKKQLYSLFVFLFPLSALAILLSELGTSPVTPVDASAASHILLAVLAYGILILATLQALVLTYQDHQLKHKHATGLIKLLPPLQTMESLLFELLWIGEILLTLLIISGLVFTTDLMEQKLAHKLVISIIAWLIYAVLLWGRHQQGWRGNKAVRWAIGGFATLLVAYFGTRFVYEVIQEPQDSNATNASTSYTVESQLLKVANLPTRLQDTHPI